jgi:hypothetical protein
MPPVRTFRAHPLEAHPVRLEHFGCYAVALVDEAEQDVLGPEVIVVGEARFCLS